MRSFLTTKEIVNLCIKTHGKKYDYSLVDYKNSKTKIKIKCNSCLNIFEQLPYNHYGSKNGCPTCYSVKSRKIQQLSFDDFVKKSRSVHKNKYDYSLVDYVNNRTKVQIKCNSCDNIFSQRPMQHMIGTGCPKCWHESYISKPEIEFLDFLKIKSRQQCIGECVVDGISNNIIYEFLGDYWHGNLNTFDPQKINEILKISFSTLNRKTVRRFKWLSNQGYKIKYIWESDWKKFIKNKNVIPNILDFDENKRVI